MSDLSEILLDACAGLDFAISELRTQAGRFGMVDDPEEITRLVVVRNRLMGIAGADTFTITEAGIQALRDSRLNGEVKAGEGEHEFSGGYTACMPCDGNGCDRCMPHLFEGDDE